MEFSIWFFLLLIQPFPQGEFQFVEVGDVFDAGFEELEAAFGDGGGGVEDVHIGDGACFEVGLCEAIGFFGLAHLEGVMRDFAEGSFDVFLVLGKLVGDGSFGEFGVVVGDGDG